MDRNTQVALRLGLIKCDGHYPTAGNEVYYCWITPGGELHSFEFQPTDYVGDSVAALTLADTFKTWRMSRSSKPTRYTFDTYIPGVPQGVGTTLSAAIVDAFLAGGE